MEAKKTKDFSSHWKSSLKKHGLDSSFRPLCSPSSGCMYSQLSWKRAKQWRDDILCDRQSRIPKTNQPRCFFTFALLGVKQSRPFTQRQHVCWMSKHWWSSFHNSQTQLRHFLTSKPAVSNTALCVGLLISLNFSLVGSIKHLHN